MNNPFFTDFNLPYNAVPFSKFKTEDFIPAAKKSIELAINRIDDIVNTLNQFLYKDIGGSNVDAAETSTASSQGLAGANIAGAVFLRIET